MAETILKEEERVAFALRSLYRQYGYLPYKMSKFEAYDLYASNKDFLVSEGVITFNDTDGKLLALKPDVTLSIIKSFNEAGGKHKVYYHENVYRISGATKQFKEIPQVGLECLGSVDGYDVYETVLLASRSLSFISKDFALDVAHLGILSAVLDEIALGEEFNREVMRLISEKNLHEIQAVCARFEVNATQVDKLLRIVRAYGDMKTVLEMLAPVCGEGKAKEAYAELQTLYALLQNYEYADKIRFDFSVVNDMKYYNGIVFKGFVDGVCEGVLSGGQYDRMMARMGKKSRAIGFAVYLDLLEGFRKNKSEYDIDTLVLYGENTPIAKVVETVEACVQAGKSVSARLVRGNLRYKEVIDLNLGGKND